MIFKSKVEILKFHNIENIENNPHYITTVVISYSKEKLKSIVNAIKIELLIDYKIKRKLFFDWRLDLKIKINKPYTREEYSQLIAEFNYVCQDNYSQVLTFGLDFKSGLMDL
jgi:hypothetical protein